MGHYTHLTLEEREMIMVLHHEGCGNNEIARRIGRDKSTISREIGRNHLWKNVYIASRAQKMYENRREPCRRRYRLENPELFGIVREKFLEHRWSPEQISNRISLDRPDLSVSTSTIYRAIYRHLLEYDKYAYGKGLALKLRHKGKRRRKSSENEMRGKIRISNDLSERPKEANDRSRLGDWEADTIVGKELHSCAVTLVDRRSRFLLLGRAESKKAVPVGALMVTMLRDKPLQSVTPDRGKEFALHSEVTRQLGVPFYFPLPHQPWQRGTNENSNGLIREYIPKGFDIDSLSEAEIRWIQDELNLRPRKCLGYRTPFEVFFSKTLHLI